MRMKIVGVLEAFLLLAIGGWMAVEGANPAASGDAAEILNLHVCAIGPARACNAGSDKPDRAGAGEN